MDAFIDAIMKSIGKLHVNHGECFTVSRVTCLISYSYQTDLVKKYTLALPGSCKGEVKLIRKELARRFKSDEVTAIITSNRINGTLAELQVYMSN